MNRHPWRSKAVVIFVLGLLAELAVHMGIPPQEVEWWVSWLTRMATLAMMLGILVPWGEKDTTPINDPRVPSGTRVHHYLPDEE